VIEISDSNCYECEGDCVPSRCASETLVDLNDWTSQKARGQPDSGTVMFFLHAVWLVQGRIFCLVNVVGHVYLEGKG
jgi:hypothetical protein